MDTVIVVIGGLSLLLAHCRSAAVITPLLCDHGGILYSGMMSAMLVVMIMAEKMWMK